MSGPVVLALRAVLAVALYAFLVFALVTLWREIHQQASLLISRRVPSISVSITSPGFDPCRRDFTQAELTIGRNPSCDLVVDSDSVSANHARLAYHHSQWWLEDLRSTNGTFLNNERLSLPTVVISGDEFRCGEVSLLIAFPGDLTFARQEEET